MVSTPKLLRNVLCFSVNRDLGKRLLCIGLICDFLEILGFSTIFLVEEDKLQRGLGVAQ